MRRSLICREVFYSSEYRAAIGARHQQVDEKHGDWMVGQHAYALVAVRGDADVVEAEGLQASPRGDANGLLIIV